MKPILTILLVAFPLMSCVKQAPQQKKGGSYFQQQLKAATQGNANAQNYMGILYVEGRDVPQDYVKARKWFEKASTKGNANSQYHMGVLYDRSLGVPQDYMEAQTWYEKAATQGHAKALQRLFGPDGFADEPLVLQWLQQKLQKYGYDPGLMSVTLTPETQRAIRNYQRVISLQVTGKPSKKLVMEITRPCEVEMGDDFSMTVHGGCWKPSTLPLGGSVLCLRESGDCSKPRTTARGVGGVTDTFLMQLKEALE